MSSSDGEVVFTSVDGARRLPRWFSLMFSMLKNFEIGAVEFQLPDGRVFRAQGAKPGPVGRCVVHNPRLFGRVLRHGEMGFAEGYIDGWWTSPDLLAFLDVAMLNNENVARGFDGSLALRLLNRFRHWLNRNTREQARKNIEAHYDLGNEFYQLWLDDTMTYSSALFGDRARAACEPMEWAQRRKYAAICDKLALKPGDHVLEIGCGWGGFAEYAAGERGLRVTGLTLSPSQLEFAQTRLIHAGLAERVDLELRDYRDERGEYDGVASIEMFEAVGEQWWPTYFGAVRDRLKPGGVASLQVITVADHLFEDYRRGMDFIQKYIFPGGMLPSPSKLREQADLAGLEWAGSMEFGPDYSTTLRRWHASFNAAWSEIEPLGFDDRFRRMWNFYLAICAACFRAGTTDVTQVALRRN
ncbi:MAG: cyclopropane-fatty-acyl-phospholipid synthase family protein [Rhodobacteraceae bacterium]|nr:cyclopropane-fatty-acyl-phospholipid synthase family protein [Paracoccaceae bacterium]